MLQTAAVCHECNFMQVGMQSRTTAQSLQHAVGQDMVWKRRVKTDCTSDHAFMAASEATISKHLRQVRHVYNLMGMTILLQC
jgi:hypothetical protein